MKADTTNFPAAWQLAEQFSLPRLAESVKAAALQDFGKLAPSGALYELTAEQLESLLREDELCCKEEFVFDAVTRWCAEAQANDEVAGRLLSFVRFALLPLTYLEQHVEKTPLMLKHPRGGWLLWRAAKEKLHSPRSVHTRHRRTFTWEDLGGRGYVRMMGDKEWVRGAFDQPAPGASKAVPLGVLAEDANLQPLLGRFHQVMDLSTSTRSVRIRGVQGAGAGVGQTFLFPYSAFDRHCTGVDLSINLKVNWQVCAAESFSCHPKGHNGL